MPSSRTGGFSFFTLALRIFILPQHAHVAEAADGPQLKVPVVPEFLPQAGDVDLRGVLVHLAVQILDVVDELPLGEQCAGVGQMILLQYAKEHHFPNPTFFVDDGVSGVTYDRPGFQAMLAEIEAERVAVCITKDLSRLGRNSALTGLYTNFTFPQYGVRYIAINDHFDTIDPNSTDSDMAGIKNWFNDNLA